MHEVSPTRDTLPDPDWGEAPPLERGLVRGDVVGRYITLEQAYGSNHAFVGQVRTAMARVQQPGDVPTR